MNLPARECFRGWMRLLKDRYVLLLWVNLLVYIGNRAASLFYSLLMLLLRWKQCAALGRQLLAQMRFPEGFTWMQTGIPVHWLVKLPADTVPVGFLCMQRLSSSEDKVLTTRIFTLLFWFIHECLIYHTSLQKWIYLFVFQELRQFFLTII